MSYQYIRDFSATNIENEFIPGSVNLFLGSAHRFLTGEKIRLPDGFMITSKAFNILLDHNQNREKLNKILSAIDKSKYNNLKEIGRSVRSLILSFELPEVLINEISEAKSNLLYPLRSSLRLAVRCVECDENQVNNNFNNLRELLLNISGEEELLKSCLKCYASLFSDQLIRYREEHKKDHFSGQMNILVQQMVRSDLASSGIMYGSDLKDSVSEDITVEGCWGLVENIEHGIIVPDVFKVIIHDGQDDSEKPLIVKTKGSKAKTLIYFDLPDLTKEATYVNIETQDSKRQKYVLNDTEILEL